jgi:hypothetical protein
MIAHAGRASGGRVGVHAGDSAVRNGVEGQRRIAHARSVEVTGMATTKQVQTARRNVKKAQQAATRKRTIVHLPPSTRRELGKQAARGRQRGGRAGRTLQDRNRQQLYELAKRKRIPGRSKMGKWDLIEAIRRAS